MKITIPEYKLIKAIRQVADLDRMFPGLKIDKIEGIGRQVDDNGKPIFVISLNVR